MKLLTYQPAVGATVTVAPIVYGSPRWWRTVDALMLSMDVDRAHAVAIVTGLLTDPDTVPRVSG